MTRRFLPLAVLALAATTGLVTTHASAAPHAAKTAPCSSTGLQAAVKDGGTLKFAADCDLHLAATLVATRDVTIDGNGFAVVLDGLTPNNTDHVQVLRVKRGLLHLTDLTIAGGQVTGADGSDGSDGDVGTDGTSPAGNGGPGHPGGNGGDGKGARGGGIFIASKATVLLSHVKFQGNTAVGGDGGSGGSGGNGGVGADSDLAGGDAGDGGNGAAGGAAGDGGTALGGAIYNKGDLALDHVSFFEDIALGGNGGIGGLAGTGGAGGDVVCSTDPCTGEAGLGGNGGDTGASGSAGSAAGGGIFSSGRLAMTHVKFEEEGATAGTPASGLVGGDGGIGGCNDAVCADAGNGGRGGDGGDGATADGGALVGNYVDTNVVSFLADAVAADAGCATSNNGCAGVGGIGATNGANGDDGVPGVTSNPDAHVLHSGLPPLALTTDKLPVAHRHHHYRARLKAAGGIRPYAFSCTHRPKWLHCSTGGVLSGKPAKAGRYTITVHVTDPLAANPTKATAKLHLRVRKH